MVSMGIGTANTRSVDLCGGYEILLATTDAAVRRAALAVEKIRKGPLGHSHKHNAYFSPCLFGKLGVGPSQRVGGAF
jgi:hypothetical protein